MSNVLPLRSLSSLPLNVSRTRASQLHSPVFRPPHFSGFANSTTLLRGTLTVVKSGFLEPGQLPDPESSEGFIRDLFGRAEGILYTLADAAVANSEAVSDTTKQSGDWLSGITSYMEAVLKVLKDGLSALHMPYAYGFAIILLTVLVKAATFPLTKKQVESAMAMRSLQPQMKAIQKKYAGDKERIQLETARVYKLAGINPLAGCLPTLATIPVWIGLYRALSNVANEGLLTEGFFWIPSLAGPTTIASRQNGSGISWLFPFIDGHPPLGWSDTFAYLVLPVLLIASQYISIEIMQSSQANDPNTKNSQVITKFLPLMIGYFALSVPSGLSLYWFTNNILSTAQQVWLQKMGGATNPLVNTSDILKEEKLQRPNPVIDTKSILKEEMARPVVETRSTVKEEKSSTTGLRPGERFKQLKEEEARKRLKREEEKRRAEEAAAKATSIAHEEDEKPVDLAKGSNGSIIDAVVSDKVQDKSIANEGNTGALASREQQSTSIPVEENGKYANASGGGKDGQFDDDKHEKEVVEVHNSKMASTKNRLDDEDGQKTL